MFCGEGTLMSLNSPGSEELHSSTLQIHSITMQIDEMGKQIDSLHGSRITFLEY